MKPVYVDDLKGNEILAEPVLSATEAVLIHSGVMMTKEYIDKLKQLDISGVYIMEKTDDGYEEILRENLKSQNNGVYKGTHIVYNLEETAERTQEIVKHVLERHIYKHNNDLKIIGEAADNIIDSVISQPEVITNVTEIRNISTDMYTHCINVCTLSTIMALRLKMSKRQVRNVAMGAILHDIGLKYIQAPYIDIDFSKMDEKDVREYKKHPIYGYSSIQDEDWISDVSKQIVLLHHEKIDGSGFPFHQKNTKLHAEVRLVSLCDDFDGFISGIGNKKMKMHEAIEYIKVNAGVIYDATIASKFLELVAVFPVGINVVTNEGEIGVVVRQNRGSTDRPVIRMLKKADGTEYEQECEKDLMKNLTVFIVDTL